MHEQAIREIRPVVVPSQFWITGTVMSIGAGLFIGFFGFVVGNMVSGLLDFGKPIDHDNFGPKIIYGVIAFFFGFAASMIFCYLKTFVEPTKIVYRVYDDRVEYEEGLFNRVARTVMFDKIIDVTLTESVLQQSHNAGSINLVTQQLLATGSQGQLSNRTITLANLPQPREVYEFVKSLTTKKGKSMI